MPESVYHLLADRTLDLLQDKLEVGRVRAGARARAGARHTGWHARLLGPLQIYVESHDVEGSDVEYGVGALAVSCATGAMAARASGCMRGTRGRGCACTRSKAC